MVELEDADLQQVVAEEVGRALAGHLASVCLLDRAFEIEDLRQELRVLGVQLWWKFDGSRYRTREEQLKGFRMYLRRSYYRKLVHLVRRRIRPALPLEVDVEADSDG